MADAWGETRPGSILGQGAVFGMCASIGHIQDDEDAGMTYMRARWYEPGSGRFISEDPARDGANWFAYCAGDPVNRLDPSGREGVWFQVGKWWVNFDNWYPEGGTGLDMRDFNWGTRMGERLGSMRFDGVLKHGAQPPDKLMKLLVKNEKFMNKIAECERHTGRAGIGLTTLDSAFMADPLFVLGLFQDIGQGFQLLANDNGN